MKEKFIVTILSNLGTNLISLFTYYFVFLNLNPTLMGIYTLVNSIITFGFIFSDLGLRILHYRFSSNENYSQLFSTFIFLKFLLLMTSVIITLSSITFFQLWGSNYAIYLITYLFSMISLNLITILITNLKTMKRILVCEISLFIYIFGRNLSILYLVFNISRFEDPLIYIYISDLLIEIFFIIFLLYISKKDILALKKPNLEIIGYYLRENKYIALRAILFIIVTNLGNLLIYSSFGHETLGFIALVSQIILLLNTISGSLIPIYISYFSGYFEKNKIIKITKISQIIEKYSSILFLSAILVVFLNGQLFLSIFLPAYYKSFQALVIMIFIPFFLGICRPYENQFIPGKKQSIFAFTGIFMYSMQLILLIILVPGQLGMVGYGLAMTIPVGLYALLSFYYAKKTFNITSLKQKYLNMIFALMAYVITFLIKNNFLNNLVSNELLLFFSTLLLLGFFLGELFIFKQLKKDDILFIFEFLKLKIYKDTLKEEIFGKD